MALGLSPNDIDQLAETTPLERDFLPLVVDVILQSFGDDYDELFSREYRYFYENKHVNRRLPCLSLSTLAVLKSN
jgi:hypothetical protein